MYRTPLLAVLAAAGLAVAACSTSSSAHHAARFTVTSTLHGLTALPHRIHWQAFPSAPAQDISEVGFLIDGHKLWVEHNAPYFYGDDGNYLVTSFLTPGTHVFTVRAVTAGGRVATDTVTASVPAAPRPPDALAGTWKGFVQQVGPPGSCIPAPCPPPGNWRLVISSIGWQVYDTAGGGGLYYVVYLSPGLAEILNGMATGHHNTDGNAWCNFGDGDQPAGRPPVRVRWTVHGSLLSFSPVGSQAASCGFTAFLRQRSGHRAVPWTRA